MASNYVTKEEKVVRMVKALRTCATPASAPQRLAAYEAAAIPAEDVVAFDHEALRREDMRRASTTNTARRAS